MIQIDSVRDAKDYLAGRIADEATRQGIPLSEIERKMLYFSETDWTLPNMLEINAEFERDYDGNEYERKIAGLIRSSKVQDRKNAQAKKLWHEAVVKLSEGDNYLSIMLNPSFEPEGPTVRPPHDRLKLWLAAFAIVFGSLGVMGLANWLQGSRFRPVLDWVDDHIGSKAASFGCVAVIVVLLVLYYAVGPKISRTINRLFDKK